jgi:hypothetical protein
MDFSLFLLIISLFFLLGIGVSIIVVLARPYLEDSIHDNRIAYFSYLLPGTTWFHVKLQTQDLFAAFNPINISVQTAACPPEIRSLQLEFVGASSYFPGDYNFSAPDFFEKQYENFTKSLQSNTVQLVNNSLTTFAGSIKNVTYTNGGEFDIGITITNKDGAVRGYGMGDTSFALKNAIRISPPEALIQLRNGRISMGLTYVAVGLTFVVVSMTGLISLWVRTVRL